MIRLNPGQNKSFKVDHPLFDGVKKHTKEEVQAIAFKAAKSDKDKLFEALKSCAASVIGRYLCHWPRTRRFEHEMVSEAFLVISEILSEITFDFVENHDILKVVGRRIVNRIDEYLNRNIGIVSTSVQNQRDNPTTFNYIEIDNLAEFNHPLDAGDTWKRDYLDVLRSIESKDYIDDYILQKTNWGRSHNEIAKEIGVDARLIYRRRRKLYQKFEEKL